jgi:hypothetical protein
MGLVCKEWDKYLFSYAADNPIWFVKLSNGETIYQDDGRPDTEPASAWLRLKKYCADRNLHIKEMCVQYRSHIEHIPQNCDGYYFCKGASGFLFSEETMHSFVVGTLSGNSLSVRHWKVPELTVIQTETRTKLGNEECLIEKSIIEGGAVTCRMPAPLKKSILNWLSNDEKQDEQE